MAAEPKRSLGRRRVEIFCSTAIDQAEIARIRTIIESGHGLTRLELARKACKTFDWRRPNGRFPERACVDLFLRLEERGEIRLPPPRRRAASYRKPLPKLLPDFLLGPTPGFEGCLRPGAELVVRPIAREERYGWEAYVERFHYLGSRPLVGESLRYSATLDGELVALLGWGAAVLKSTPRDRYVGWDAQTKRRNLGFVVNNARFLILPWVRMPNLASRVLSTNLKRLSSDWEVAYDHPVWLAETFVDLSRFRGTCYRAANWRYIGDTKGYARTGGGSSYTYSHHGKKKAVFVYPLHRRTRQLLCASIENNRTRRVMVDVESLDLDGENGLLPVLRSCTDPRMRRGIRHPLESVLAVAACAVLASARSYDAIAQWAKDQSEEVLRRLKCRRGKPPSESTIRRVLKRVDSEEVDRKLGCWLVKQQSLEGQAIAIDGKTLRGSRDGENAGVHLLGAVVHSTGVIIAQTQVPGKTNEITRVEPLFDGLDIAGTVVTADALLTQKEIARHLTEDKKADYVFTVKDNQPTLRKDIEDFFELERQEAERLHRAKSLDDEAFPP